MTIPANDFVDSYLNWLKSNIQWKEISGFLEFSTPFLDRHNDHLQIYVKEEGAKYILTDDGYTLNDLTMSGCDLSSRNRQNVLQTITNTLSVNSTLFSPRNYINLSSHNHQISIYFYIIQNDQIVLIK